LLEVVRAETRTVSKATLAAAIVLIGLPSFFLLLNPYATAQSSQNGSGWILIVDGSVANNLSLTDEEIRAMPKTTVYAELYCVDFPSFALARGNWTGVRLGFLLEKSQVLADALKVAFHANDGYASDSSLTVAMQNDTVIAYELNGQPLSENLRLVVPGKWGYKWVSKLAHIEIVNYDFKGTWESMGYSDEANILFLSTDLNKDGNVNSGDATAVTAAFGTRPGNPKWNEAADLDWNGLINIVDVALVTKDYGKTSNS